jgi:hypothetical protein
MVAAPTTSADLHTFRLAHPVVRSSSRFELTALALLSIVAMTLWLVVLPVEFVFRVTV